MALSWEHIPKWHVATVIALLLLLFRGTEGITCLECNVYFQSYRGTACHSPFHRTDCVACLKVITKVKMHDGWLTRRTAEVESKYCIRVEGSPGLRDEGCYYQQNNGGYTERCFCYTDDCNQGTQLLPVSRRWIYGVLSLGFSALFRYYFF